MGGVDHSDQLRGYYNVRMKCRKSYKYIFWFLFDLSVTNAYILCKQYTALTITDVKAFRVMLAKELIGSYSSRKRPGRPSLMPPPQRYCQSHFPVRGADKVHRCHYCYHHWHGKRSSTVWYCKDCNLFLCHSGKEDDCFLLYHTRLTNTSN